MYINLDTTVNQEQSKLSTVYPPPSWKEEFNDLFLKKRNGFEVYYWLVVCFWLSKEYFVFRMGETDIEKPSQEQHE